MQTQYRKILRWFPLLILLCVSLTMVRATDEVVVFLGDSITFLGGDNCSKPKGWTKWFIEKRKTKTAHSYARSGATWSNTLTTREDTAEYTGVLADNNVIYNQVRRLQGAYERGEQTNPDLIIIAAGINDTWFSNKRPSAFSKTANEIFADSLSTDSLPTTMAESIIVNCTLLKNTFPNARIILTSPLQSTQVSMDSLNRTRDIIRGCAEQLENVDFINLSSSEVIDRKAEKKQHRYTYDGTHTSVKGAQRVAQFIQQAIQHNHEISNSRNNQTTK